MSSILTNNGAMVALQTLKSVNKNLAATQNAISTGKDVATAKDNSAVWAISKVMESDVKGFNAIKDSLALGESTVAVARNASETVTDLLNQMKGKIVAAQEDNVDRAKINDDVTALRDQIASVVGAAQFNGLNLVDGSAGTASILASLDRDSSGSVTASSISVASQDLSTGGYTSKGVLAGSDNVTTDNDAAGFTMDKSGGSGDIVIDSSTDNFAAGDKVSITIGDKVASYTVQAGDLDPSGTYDSAYTDAIVAVGLKNQIDALGITGVAIDYDSGSAGTLSFVTGTATAGADADRDVTVSAQFTNAGAGGLGALSSIDVSTDAGAAAALGTIETLIDSAIDASAAFGSAQGRIETQKEFISNLSDSFKSGIGSLVDADMEETSARLQALQVQQQLATQSLSIANQAPQSILSLFR
ncbi:flagellin [Ruegeria halocynthiae]|uniref:Flagellin n=1 Tax=Ruegeria halocynthiae TaxID=985054 RepID=A0A1H3BXM2_9RHOB|nr:flagellin [Ruegeria halocynthiae]SDX46616.1 flagellin [Ruegeria halocynthiae]